METEGTPAPGRNHEITLRLKDGEVVSDEGVWPEGMSVGDTVHFVSPDGEVMVKFEVLKGGPLPFSDETIIDTAAHTVVNPSTFLAKCFIKPHGEKDFKGWADDHPKSGMQPGTTGGGK